MFGARLSVELASDTVPIWNLLKNSYESLGRRLGSGDQKKMHGFTLLSCPVGLDFYTEAGFDFSDFFPLLNPSGKRGPTDKNLYGQDRIDQI